MTDEETMSEANHYDRRRFIGTAVMATAGAGLVASSSGVSKPHMNGSLGPIKQIDAGDLDVGYAEAGPSNGPPAILLHEWPQRISSHVDVSQLATGGYRVIVPYARGFGSTRFASNDAMRNGQQTAVAPDVMALMDALEIEKALVGGFDAGARTAEVMAALWPQRVKGIVPVSGYAVVHLAANQRPLPPKEELEWWYKYYFVRDGLR
jgi:pimeloyl-ACP methyl ester carboxylesterase